MLDQEGEELVEALKKQVEELTTELQEVKKEREEEITLIPGAEYDFVPSIKDKVIGQFMIRVGKITKADSLLGLTEEEWRLYSTPD